MSACKYLLLCITFISFSTLEAQYYHLGNNDISSLCFEKKGDLKLSISFPLWNQNNLQLGYSPIKNLSLSAAYYRYNKTEGSIKTKASSFASAVGFYRSFKNPFRSNFFVFSKLKTIQFQSHLGYSFNYNKNIFSPNFNSEIELRSHNLFFRLGAFFKYKRLTLGVSRSYTNLYFKHANIIGRHTSRGGNRIGKFLLFMGDDGRLTYYDTTTSFKYDILGFELFMNIHSSYTSFRYDFAQLNYNDIGVVVNLDTLFAGFKKHKSKSDFE